MDYATEAGTAQASAERAHAGWLAARDATRAAIEAPPPFAPGDRVIVRRYPHHGSLMVRDVRRPPAGGWRVCAASADGYELHIDAARLARCPADWREPPVLPMVLTLAGDGYEPTIDRAAYADWRAAMRAWTAQFGGER